MSEPELAGSEPVGVVLGTEDSAVGGHARLDSLFLDEGFGSLDPETLETVTSAVEALREGGRLVGIITHIGELAERMPVRFVVHKSPRGSRVVREGPATASVRLAEIRSLP